jgi:hypothetical protein
LGSESEKLHHEGTKNTKKSSGIERPGDPLARIGVVCPKARADRDHRSMSSSPHGFGSRSARIQCHDELSNNKNALLRDLRAFVVNLLLS